MSEITTGIRSILKYGRIYRLVQLFFGEKKSKHFIIDNYISDACEDSVILDMGCGAGNLAHFIADEIKYVGFDPNKHYIESANKKFKHNTNRRFYTGAANSAEINTKISDASIDYAVVHGVFHHVSDEQIVQMFELAKRVLKPGAKMIILEPAWYHGQSLLNKMVMSMDRGKNIKSISQWVALTCRNVELWADTESAVHKNLIRFYDLIIICVVKKQPL